MKKYVNLYVGILLAVFFVLFFADLKGDYAVERRLWGINRKYAQALKDPKAVPSQIFNDMVRSYAKVIKQYKDSKAIPGAHILLGRLYVTRGDFDKGRDILEDVLKSYADYPELCAEAISLIARTHELEKNWPKAKELYQKIIKEYPGTATGLAVPLYIANHYQAQNDFRNTMASYNQAVDFYKRMIAGHPDSVIEFESLRYLANCYVAQSRWMEAVETLKQILLKYPSEKLLTVERAELIIKTINTIVTTQIRNYDIAIAIYTEFIQKYPQHPLTKTFKALIEQFEELKSASAASGK